MTVDYFTKYDDSDFRIRKQQRNDRVDRRAKMKQEFMKVNSRGLKDVILPILGDKSRKTKRKK